MGFVLMMDTSVLEDETLFTLLYQQVSPERKAKIDRIHVARGKRLSLGAGFLLQEGMQRLHFTGAQIPDIAENEHGKPYWVLQGVPLQLYFNLSHDGDVVMAAFSDYPVGIDVAQMRPVEQSLLKRVLSEKEQAYVEQDLQMVSENKIVSQRFFELWTRKEAYLKALGTGIGTDLTKIEVLDDALPKEGKFYEIPISVSGKEMYKVSCYSADCDWHEMEEIRADRFLPK